MSSLKECILVILCLQGLSATSSGSIVSNPGCESWTPFVQSINDFGFELNRKLNSTDNVFISPFSIYTVIAMLYSGARGNTAKQIEETLLLGQNGLNGDSLKQLFKNLLENYRIQNGNYNLDLANGIFLQDGFPLRDEYIEDMASFYDSMVKSLDFLNSGEQVKDEINEWVSNGTRGKIDKMFHEPLDPSTVMVLLNAIYFKGTWKTKFDESRSTYGSFRKGNEVKRNVLYMTMLDQKFPYYEDQTIYWKFLELPYKGNEISMLLALPMEEYEVEAINFFRRDRPRIVIDHGDLESLGHNFTSNYLCNVLAKLRNVELSSIKIPKFNIKYEKELKGTLSTMGIEDVFRNGADLSGITADALLKVSKVTHKAVIDVNEAGSEAAAVTGIQIVPYSGFFRQRRFDANRPFLFYIIDKRNGLILFSGRLNEPA